MRVCGSGEPFSWFRRFFIRFRSDKKENAPPVANRKRVMSAMKTVETRLYLIRHGQAVVNVSGVLGGPKGDTGLTALGRAQAERLRERLAASAIRADVLLASSLPRARETAEIIAPGLGLPVQLDDDLHEIRVGADADGLSRDEYVRRFGWMDVARYPHTPIDPGGESWARFLLRVAETLDRIEREHAGKSVVVVCHGGVIEASFVHFFGMSHHAVPPARFHTSNTSLTLWTHARREENLHWRLDFYNDAHHLDGMDAATVTPLAIPIAAPDRA